MTVIDTRRGRIRAVLGPTNTGKTHLAIERMLGHSSGMIGFPLRLLARENYDRICALKGASSVALITGEEKIIPAHPKWYICTVEAMPLDRFVDFLAIDEIQLCADRDRGHIFTDRLLHARGRDETMFLGSDTMAPLVKQLVPDVEIESRPRFSTLSYTSPKKLTRLPRRTAVVAFSVNEVYAMAETIRQHRGGTAVVLGALSPRTRNAQVAMYQAGEVDYLVATDAIGMGLNMDVDHVAFASIRKFDGQHMRALTPAEVGQIAGRAGRHMNDGTFSVTNNLRDFDEDIVEAVENHEFQQIPKIYWRNRRLDFKSPKLLLRSLQTNPNRAELMRSRVAEDHQTLMALMRDEDIMLRADAPDRIRLLWEICQVPDFRKVTPDLHAELVSGFYTRLCDHDRLPDDWVADHIRKLDRTDGDIDVLTARLAKIRTWAYVSHRSSWVRDSDHWQERTRVIEDAISDALHEQLMQRFVDKRATLIGRGGKERQSLLSSVAKDGRVMIEGHMVGRLNGFRFQPDRARDTREAKNLHAAAAPALVLEMQSRTARLERAVNKDIKLNPLGRLVWEDNEIASLKKGDNPLGPQVTLLANDIVDSSLQTRVVNRLESWLKGMIEARFSQLNLDKDHGLTAPARGILFQLREGMGSLAIADLQQSIKALSQDDRKALGKRGVRFGTQWIFVDRYLKPDMIRLRAVLWAVWSGVEIPAIPNRARPSLPLDYAPSEIWPRLGYVAKGPLALRQDRLEHLLATLRAAARKGPFAIDGDMLKTVGCSQENMVAMMKDLGTKPAGPEHPDCYLMRGKTGRKQPNRAKMGRKPSKNAQNSVPGSKGHRRKKKTVSESPNSPFAALKELFDKQ
ncbi:helicase-related protein [Aestuariispira insulae]|nr:helicase-related protein [Aestuariispira insulae]